MEQTTPPTPLAQPISQPHGKHWLKWVLIVVAVALLSLGATYAVLLHLTQQSNEKPVSTINVTPSNIDSPKTTIYPAMSLTQNFRKRFFDITDKLFDTHPYPAELLIAEDNLTALSCTHHYVADYQGSYVSYDENTKTTFRPNTLHIELIKEALKTLPPDKPCNSNPNPSSNFAPNSVDAFMLCETQDNKKIVEYESWCGGGGSNNISYIGLVNLDNTIKKIADLPNDGTAYFGCSKLLQLSSTNMLYLQCGGGDGPGGSLSIYEINLNTYSKRLVIMCTTLWDESTGKATVNCK